MFNIHHTDVQNHITKSMRIIFIFMSVLLHLYIIYINTNHFYPVYIEFIYMYKYVQTCTHITMLKQRLSTCDFLL